MTNTPKVGAPELATSQASKEATTNQAFRILEAGAGLFRVEDDDATAPPGSCADGAQYIPVATATGLWAGKEKNIAIAVGTNAANGWYFIAPEEGMRARIKDENIFKEYDGSAWSTPSTNLDDLADVDTSGVTDGDVLTYDASSPSGWRAQAPVTGVTTLDGLSDVDTTGVSDGDVLTYDSSSPSGWRAEAPAGGGGSAWSIVFKPLDNEAPTANFATLDTRNNHPVLDFDTTTGEAAIFSGVLPADYGGGGLTVTLHWGCTTATTGTVGWLVAIERIGAVLDIDADSFASDQTVTAATTSGSPGILTVTSVNISNGANMDSLAAGEAFRIRITRDVANDTAAGDAELLRVVVVEQ